MHQDVLLSRKPEASLHLQTRKMEGKAPHLSPVSCTGVEGILLMGEAGMKLGSLQLPPPGSMHLTPLSPGPPPGQGCAAPAAEG